MNRQIKDDIFNIQTRLFRLFQVKENLSPEDTTTIFKKYDLFSYIETCYEEYHVQGDETNLKDLYKYLKNRGWSK